MSLITLGLDGLYACGGMIFLSVLTILVLSVLDARDARARLAHVPMDWTGTFIGPERSDLPQRLPARPRVVPAELEPYVDYDRAKELHTAPIDYARAMKAAAKARAEEAFSARLAA